MVSNNEGQELETPTRSSKSKSFSLNHTRGLTIAELDRKMKVKLHELADKTKAQRYRAREADRMAMCRAREKVKKLNPDIHLLSEEEQTRQLKAGEDDANTRRAAVGIDMITVFRDIEAMNSQEELRIKEEFVVAKNSIATRNSMINSSSAKDETDRMSLKNKRVLREAGHEPDLGFLSTANFLAVCRKRSSSESGMPVEDDSEGSVRCSARKRQKRDYSDASYYLQAGI